LSDTLESKIVVTRKEHQCWGCARKIPKGLKMRVLKLAEDGKVVSSYWCETCQLYWNRHCNNDDEISCGELRDENRKGWEAVRDEIEGVLVK
jgi:hypothetical protein